MIISFPCAIVVYMQVSSVKEMERTDFENYVKLTPIPPPNNVSKQVLLKPTDWFSWGK